MRDHGPDCLAIRRLLLSKPRIERFVPKHMPPEPCVDQAMEPSAANPERSPKIECPHWALAAIANMLSDSMRSVSKLQ